MKFHTPFDLSGASRTRTAAIILPTLLLAVLWLPLLCISEISEFGLDCLDWQWGTLARWAGWRGPGIDE